MADLDEKLLKSLDDRIKQMNGSLLQLASTVDILKRESKGWISSLINEFNAGSLKDLLGVNEARKNISAVKADLKALKDTINSGTLTPEKERAAINIYAEKRKELNNLMMSDEQIAKRILQIVNKMTSVMTPQQKALQQQQEAYRKILNIQQEIQRIRNRQSERGARGLVVDKATVDAEVALIKRLEAEMRVLKRERTALAKESGVSNSTKLSKGDYAQSLEYQRQLTRETVRHGEALERIKQHQKEVKSGFEQMLPTLRRLASAFGVAFSVQGLVNFGKKIVETRGEFELQQVALRSILQNKQLADEIWDKTMQAALQSPFTAMQLTRYTKQLAAYRIETDKLFDTTKRLADVSAGLGVDMQRLILAYGQVKAANYLRASEIRQFTEAGVNILGELSTYFSKTRGEMISTAQVMDMVQKRMVKFEDVEAIFKRMTDEGGIFYDMQRIQAETVWGQLRKLRDAYDQMQNSIGESNEGVIKDMVSLALSLVKNWRTVASVITSIGWGAFIGYITKTVVALNKFDKVTVSSVKNLPKLSRGILSLNKSIGTLGKSMAAFFATNGWTIALAAAAVAISAIVSRIKTVNAEMDEINEKLQRNFDTQQNLKQYNETLEENNRLIKSGTLSADELKEKRSENAEILSKLKNEYPDLVKNREQELNGVVDLTKEIKAYNDELERELTLTVSLTNQGNWWQKLWSDTDAENIQEYVEDLNKQRVDMIKVQTAAKSALLELHKQGIDEGQAVDALNKIKNLDLSNIESAVKEYEQIVKDAGERIWDAWEVAGLSQAILTSPSAGIAQLARHYLKDVDKYENAELVRGLPDVTQFNWDSKQVKDALKNSETAVKDAIEGSVKDVSDFSSIILDKYTTYVGNAQVDRTDDFVSENSKKITDKINEGTIDIFKSVRNVAEQQLGITTEVGRNWFNKWINEIYGVTARRNEKLKELQEQGVGLVQAMATVDKEIPLYDVWAGVGKTSGTGGSGGGGDEGKKSASKLISLIKEMRAEYDKLSKSAYGYAKSEDAVRKAYDKAMDEILVKAGVDKKYDFTTNEGMIAALEKVKAYADKLGPEAAAEVEKYIGQLKSEIELNVQVKVRDDFNRDLEKMFSNYELTLELQGLNIPEDMAKDLFPDLDYTTLGEIQDRMRKFYEDQRNANGEVLFDKDDLEQYRKWADKVDAEILKSRKEKAKQYSKYLEKEYSDRAKLEMQHAKDVAFVTANVSDETQRKNIITQIDKKYQDDLNELHWKSFKESSFYVEMMDDISSLPKEYMQMMLDKIEEILQHPETLSPRALKEAINARQKALEAQMNLEPLDVMRSSMKKIREAMADDSVGGQTMRQTRENIDAQIAKTQELINEKEDEARCWDETAAAMQIYENAQHEVANAYGKLDAETRKLIQNNGVLFELTARETEKNRNQQQIKENQRILDELNKKQRDGITLTESEQNQLSGLKDQNATLEARNRALESQIALLSELITKEKELATIRGQQVGTDAEKQRGKGGVGTAAEARNRAQESKAEADNLEKANQKLKAWKKSFKDFADSMKKWNASVANMINKVSAMGNAFYDTFDALGGETNALTEGWREFGNTMTQTITSALSLIPQLVTGFITAGSSINAAMGVIGLIAEAIQLVLVAVGAIAKLHDAHYEREIEIQQKKIDALQDAYARLEKQIERTWDAMSYVETYDEMIQNLQEQNEALVAQRNAEEAKKNTDEEKVKGINKQIKENEEAAELAAEQLKKDFGAIGVDDYRSAAEGFVDAWKSAFLETGDGLQGLQDHFDEFLQDWFTKQATMLIARKYLDTMFEQINDAVQKNGSGGVEVMWDELQDIMDTATEQFPAFSAELEEFFRRFGGFGEGSLSGLAAGIQGMTEEQANILEAYWNSVRMYTASIDQHVAMIASALGVGGNSPSTNPMLQQMSLIAANTQATHQLLQSVTRSGHSLGGYGIKVFND